MHGRLRVFARYMEPAEVDALAEGLMLEQRLRSRITELQVGEVLAWRSVFCGTCAYVRWAHWRRGSS